MNALCIKFLLGVNSVSSHSANCWNHIVSQFKKMLLVQIKSRTCVKQNKQSINEEVGYSEAASTVHNRKYYWREQTNDPDSSMHTSQYISGTLTPLAFCVRLNHCLSLYHQLWLLVRRIVMFSAVFISVVLGLLIYSTAACTQEQPL